MDRYQRQTMLPEVGDVGQQRLAQARVAVIGAGGLSATLLPLLAGAGVGTLHIYDGDRVALHNLHRQTLFGMQDIGALKVHCAQQALARLNPDCRVEAYTAMLTASGVDRALEQVDLVIDAADNFATTWLLSDACQRLALPLISASVLGRQGYVGGFCGGAPGYRALFPQLPRTAANCNTAGVMGPAVAALGAIQAQMALSVLLAHQPSPLGSVTQCDFSCWHFNSFRFDGAEEPVNLLPFIDRQLLCDDDCVVDLRSSSEAPHSVSAHAQRILPADIAGWQPPADRRIVLVCASGLRAGQAAQQLQQRGLFRLALLAANY